LKSVVTKVDLLVDVITDYRPVHDIQQVVTTISFIVIIFFPN